MTDIEGEEKPYVCPVCQGKGQVYSGFYLQQIPRGSANAVCFTPETCRTCKGTGVIWHKEEKS